MAGVLELPSYGPHSPGGHERARAVRRCPVRVRLALSATGDVGGSEVGVRIGLGAEYRMNSQLGLVAQWMHQDAGPIPNDHFTLSVTYHFRVD